MTCRNGRRADDDSSTNKFGETFDKAEFERQQSEAAASVQGLTGRKVLAIATLVILASGSVVYLGLS